MKDCETIRESIDSWLDGELNPAESELVRTHVSSCSDCSEVRRQLEKLQLALKDELLVEASQIEFLPFWREFERRINEKRSWPMELAARCRAFFATPQIAWAVPAVIVLLLAALSLDAVLPWWRFGGGRNNFASVESIDAYGRSVALLRQDETRTTVIWLYEDQEGENEAAEEATKSGPAF